MRTTRLYAPAAPRWSRRAVDLRLSGQAPTVCSKQRWHCSATRRSSNTCRAQWQRDGDSIVRDLQLSDFAAAIALVDRVAELAESANHHPDILVHGWNKLRLTLSTHSEGGLTAADFALAERIDSLY
jgi:4a-hydroxytetrahydrobiopterin dehydratase